MDNREKGFSLVQVLFVVSIISGLIYISVGQQDLFRKTKKTADIHSEINELSNHLVSLLSDPYICSATVDGRAIGTITGPPLGPGGARIGEASGGALLEIVNAVLSPNYDPLTSPPGMKFYLISGLPHLVAGTEPRPGVMVTSMNLVSDGMKDFIRVSFSPKATIKGSKLGGGSVNKDFYISGKKNAGKFYECNMSEHDSDLRGVCDALKGQWDFTLKKCLMTDLIDKNADLIPIWIYTDGTVNTIPVLTTKMGDVSCTCNQKMCSRASKPCLCPSPSCSTVPGCGANCSYGKISHWDRCQRRVLGMCLDEACMYRRECGLPSPPNGHMIKMR